MLAPWSKDTVDPEDFIPGLLREPKPGQSDEEIEETFRSMFNRLRG